LGAGGAALGGVLSKGNPYAIVGGAAGGVLLGEGLHYANNKLNDQSYQTGYDKGRSDAVKQQYWLYVSIQQAKAGDEPPETFQPHRYRQLGRGCCHALRL
jgi:hypothetical protein